MGTAGGSCWRCAPWPPSWPWGSTPGGTGAGPSWGSWPYWPWPGIPCGRSCWSRRRTCSAPPGRGAPGCPFWFWPPGCWPCCWGGWWSGPGAGICAPWWWPCRCCPPLWRAFCRSGRPCSSAPPGGGPCCSPPSFQGTAASGGPSCSVWPAWGSSWPSSPPPCPGRDICAPTGPPTPGTSW